MIQISEQTFKKIVAIKSQIKNIKTCTNIMLAMGVVSTIFFIFTKLFPFMIVMGASATSVYFYYMPTHKKLNFKLKDLLTQAIEGEK